MSHNDYDNQSVIVYAQAYKTNYSDRNQGLLKPIFEETPDGLRSVNPNDFLKNGLIHVTTGYDFFKTDNPNQFFRVKATVSNSWNENTAHDGISKYVTYDRNAEIAPYLAISMVIDGEYPKAGRTEGITCTSTKCPIDGFFIHCLDENNTDVIVGPFSVIKSSISMQDNGVYIFKYKAPDKPTGGGWAALNTAPHSALAFEVELIPNDAFLSFSNQKYLVNNGVLPFSSAKLIDLSSDESILKWASKLFRATGSDLKTQIPQFKKLIENIPEDSNLPKEIFESRKERLRQHPQIIERVDGLRQILSNYLRTLEGETLIKGFVDANRDTLLQKHLYDEVEKLKIISEKKLESEIQDLSLKKHLLSEKVNEIEEKWNKLRNSKKGMELEELNKEIEKYREEKNIILKVEELQTHKKILKSDIETLKEDKTKATSLLEEIQRSIQQSQDTHKTNLLQLKMGLDALTGNVRDASDLKSNIIIQNEFNSITAFNDESRADIINSIATNLEKQGRIITKDEVSVLLTCIFQNLIVTLAGKPGSGKTSTARSIADILSVKENNKYVHVQVQRGWSSDKDLLGFFNKLSISYDPDPHGLYKLINGLQDVSIENQASIVLLDEANLSPIEHYWSGFMGACDGNDAFTIDNPNNKKTLSLPPGIKFIATVNYDRTTEPLSERFLDRTPVIYLEGLNSDLFSNEYTDISGSYDRLNYSFTDLNKLFGKPDNPKLISDEERIIKEIMDEHRFININHRKVYSIRNFTDRLRGILDSDNSEPLKAFDYATMIFILPVINGQGIEYSKSIQSFYDFLSSQGLSRSSEMLNTIISNSRFDTYSYFS